MVGEASASVLSLSLSLSLSLGKSSNFRKYFVEPSTNSSGDCRDGAKLQALVDDEELSEDEETAISKPSRDRVSFRVDSSAPTSSGTICRLNGSVECFFLLPSACSRVCACVRVRIACVRVCVCACVRSL